MRHNREGGDRDTYFLVRDLASARTSPWLKQTRGGTSPTRTAFLFVLTPFLSYLPAGWGRCQLRVRDLGKDGDIVTITMAGKCKTTWHAPVTSRGEKSSDERDLPRTLFLAGMMLSAFDQPVL